MASKCHDALSSCPDSFGHFRQTRRLLERLTAKEGHSFNLLRNRVDE